MKSQEKVFKVGAKVRWNWLRRPVVGTVKQIYFKPVSKTFNGFTVKRNGSAEKPAYLIKTESGSVVLKLHTELTENKKTR